MRLDSPHLLCHRKVLEDRDVLERLIRVNQAYKTELSHALNTQQRDFQILRQINRIDYTKDWGSQSASFDIELSFTWLDWQIMDMVNSDSVFYIEDIDQEQQLQLCFNILPQGRTMLHMLALQTNLMSNDQIRAISALKDLFSVARIHQDLDVTGADSGCAFEVPILPDVYGKTPLDICLGLVDQKNARIGKIGLYKSIKTRSEDVKASENLAMVEILFRGIKDYGFLHSSHFITDAVIEAIRLGLPALREYFDARLKNIDHFFA